MEIKISANIRTAKRNDLFGNNDVPILNSTYFFKDPDGNFKGPKLVSDETDVNWFIHAYIFRNLYVLTSEEQGFCFQMNLRLAEKFDLIDNPDLKINQMYFIKESEYVFDGPHVITQSSSVGDLAALFLDSKVYVIDEKQDFFPHIISHSA